MKLLLTTIAAVVLVGCGESQQSAPAPEAKPEPPTAKAPDISIHVAAQYGKIEAVNQHIAAGTDVNAKNDDGETPLDVAFLYNETETADPLRKHGGKHGTIHGAARGGDIEVVKEFLATGTDVNAKSSWNGSTPLHHAAEYGHKEVAELLIAEGADVNAPAKYGLTPLDVAIQSSPFLKGHPETADLLRKHGGKTGEELKAAGN